MTRFTIGRAANAANVNVETIRFYERKGLIEQPLKPSSGGPREYDCETVYRIRFVRQAQEIGFSKSGSFSLFVPTPKPIVPTSGVAQSRKGKKFKSNSPGCRTCVTLSMN